MTETGHPAALFDRGEWEEAVAGWCRQFRLPCPSPFPLGIRLDPEQDLIGDAPGNRVRPEPRELLAFAAALRRWDPRRAAVLEAAVRHAAGDSRRALGLIEASLRRDPRDPWARLLRFKIASDRFFETRALRWLRQASADAARVLADHPGLVPAWALRAAFHAGLERYEETVQDLDRTLELDPGHAWALSIRAEVRSETGDAARALEDSDSLIRKFPARGWPYALRGRAKARLGDAPGAFADFDRALAAEPRYGEIWAWRGEAKRKSGDLPGARRDLDRALRLDPRSAMALLWRGKTRLIQGDARGADADITASIRLDPRVELAYAWRAEARFKASRFRGAVEDLDRAYPLDPAHTWSGPGGARRRDAMLADLDRGVSDHPSSVWAKTFRGRCRCECADPALIEAGLSDLDRAPAWAGVVEWRLARPERALRRFEQALRADPKAHWPAAWRGRVLLGSDRPRQALRELSQAVRRGSSAWSWMWKGEAELAVDLPTAASESLEQALAFALKEPEGIVLAADALRRSGRAAQAVERLERSARSRPAGPAERLALCVCLWQAGRRPEAAAAFQRWTSEEPDYFWHFLRQLSPGADPLRLPGDSGVGAVLDRLMAARLGLAVPDFARLRRLFRLPFRRSRGVATQRRLLEVLQPKDWLTACVRAELLLRAGSAAEGLALLETVTGETPGWVPAWRARMRLWLGREREAIAELDAALRASPEHRLALGWLGEALGKVGRHAEAVHVLDRAIALDRPFHRREAGVARWRLGWMETDLRLGTEHLQAFCRRGEAKLKQGHIDEGLADLAEAERLAPAADWVHAWRGELFLWLGRAAEAARSLARAIELDPKHFWGQAWMGGALVESGRFKEALPYLDKAVAADPFIAEAFVWRGEARLMTGRVRGAMADLARALQLDSKYHLVYRGRGDGRVQPEAIQPALSALERAGARTPGLADVQAWRGYLLHRLGRDGPARRAFDAALALNGDHALALAWRGELFCAQRCPKEALSDLDRALALQPTYLHAHGWRGRAMVALGKAEAAVKDFDLALELDPNTAWVYAWRGAAHLDAGRLEQALVNLDTALLLDSSDPTAMSWREQARAGLEAARAAPPIDGQLKEALARAERRVPVCELARRGEMSLAMLLEAGRAAAGASHGDRRAAARALLKFRSRNGPAVARLNAGVVADLEAAARTAPDPWVFCALGMVRHALKDFPQAVAAYDQAIHMCPKWELPWLLKGDSLHAFHRPAEAKACFQQAVELAPRSHWAWAMRGRAQPRPREAVEDLGRALALAPRGGWLAAWLHTWRGQSLLQAGDTADALSDLDRAVRLDPAYDRGWLWRGAARLALGRAADAARDLERAAALDPRHDLSFFMLGQARARLGDLERARAALRRACRIHQFESWEWGVNSLEQLSPLRREHLVLVEDLGRGRSWAHAWLAQAYLADGKPQRCLEHLRSARAGTARAEYPWILRAARQLVGKDA